MTACCHIESIMSNYFAPLFGKPRDVHPGFNTTGGKQVEQAPHVVMNSLQPDASFSARFVKMKGNYANGK